MTQQTPAFDAGSALSALRQSEASVRRATNPNPPILYLLWGTVYTLGYLAVHAALFGWLAMSLPLALTIFAALTAAGAAISAALGAYAGKGLRGESRRRGLFYGLTWASGMISVGFIVVAFLRLSLESATVIWLSSVIATLLVGVLFATAGAAFLDRSTFFQGIALLVANVGTLLIGPGPYVLVGWLAACAVLFIGAVIAARRTTNRTS